jgi:hypothetical protein
MNKVVKFSIVIILVLGFIITGVCLSMDKEATYLNDKEREATFKAAANSLFALQQQAMRELIVTRASSDCNNERTKERAIKYGEISHLSFSLGVTLRGMDTERLDFRNDTAIKRDLVDILKRGYELIGIDEQGRYQKFFNGLGYYPFNAGDSLQVVSVSKLESDVILCDLYLYSIYFLGNISR